MASSPRLVCLCGLWLAVLGCSSAFEFISENMKEDLDKIGNHFNVSDRTLYGNPLFLKGVSNLEEEEQKLFLGEVLDVYLRILRSMIKSTEEEDLKRSLRHTIDRVDNVKKHYFQSKGHLKAQLQVLWAIEVNNSLVQRKAMRELKQVFHKASILGNKNQTSKVHSRRRRQTHSSRV